MLIELKEGDNSSLENLLQIKSDLHILYFTASWCGPCKTISPYVKELSNLYKNVTFYKIDVDIFEELSSEMEINCMPTFKIFKNNLLVDFLEGADRTNLLNKIQKNLN